MSFPNDMMSILFNRETDEKPPHPVEPYGSRQLPQTKTQTMSDAFLVGYFENYAVIHGTDEVLIGKPQPQGPKKPIRPRPFDPYGSKRPSMAHNRELPGLACAIDGITHGAPTKTMPFGRMVRTLAQLLDDHMTANKSTTL